jgi:hypothetical protein
MNPWDNDPVVDPFAEALTAEGAKGKIADIARSIYQQESASGKNAKTSNAGAVGGMQIIPATFKGVADKDWDINDPTQNARAGIRYIKQLYEQAGGDPALTAAGYYGGPGGLEKARRGVAVSDPRNPNAPTTLQYGQQVAARLPKEKGLIQRGVEAVIPSANAAEVPTGNPWDNDPIVEATPQVTKEKSYDPTEGMSTTDRVLSGIGMGMTKVGRAVGQAVGLVNQSDIDEANRLDAHLAATTGGKVGNVIGQGAAVAPAMFIPGANTYLGATAIGAGIGALTTEGGIADRAQGAAFGALGGAGGKALGDALGMGVRYVAGQRATAQAANAGRDAAAVQARGAGYTIPPADTNPTMTNELLNGLSGKIKTAQVASARNQGTTNALARQALGLAPDEQISIQGLEALRRQAGNSYSAARAGGTIAPDAQYQNALQQLSSQYQGAAQSFPALARNEVQDLAIGLNVPSIESSAAVDMVKVLREGADKAFSTGDKALGKANRQAAEELEGLLERHLTGQGSPDAVKAIQDARKLIAKTYSVQKGLNDATGDVSATALSKQLSKGKPLTDELRTIAEANLAFPKATQSLKEAPKAVSPLDFAVAVTSGAATGNPLMAATLAARPAVRSVLLSKAYQSMAGAQKYEPNALRNALEKALASRQLANYAPAGMALGSVRAAEIPRVDVNLDLLNEGGR